jgi:hypothetical protein
MQNNNELAPWLKADLPEPPTPRGLSWIGVCGPGVIVLGLSIGSGEFLLGPAIFVTRPVVAVGDAGRGVFQTVFNTLACMALFYGFFVSLVVRSLT